MGRAEREQSCGISQRGPARSARAAVRACARVRRDRRVSTDHQLD